MAKVTDDGVDTTDTCECHMSRLEYLTLEDNNMALSPEEKLELVALEIQKDAIMKKHQFFSSWKLGNAYENMHNDVGTSGNM